MAGDYTKFQRHYQTLTTDVFITALTPSPTTVLTVRNANYQIYIQKAELVVTTFVASILTLVGATSGKVYARFDVPASPSSASVPSSGTEYYLIDYGPTGLGVNVGESVQLVIGTSGVVANLHIEAYQKAGTLQQGVVFSAQGPNTLT